MKLLRHVEMLRSAWKRPIALPPALAARRGKLVETRTGPQLARLCRRAADKAGPGVSDDDRALLDCWLRLGPEFAVARRVLGDAVAAGAPAPRRLLAVGGAAASSPPRDLFRPRAERTVAVEPSAAARDAANFLLGDRGIEWRPFLGAVAVEVPSPERSFDVVVAARSLGAAADVDLHLAILWGCVAEGGVLALVEDGADAALVAAARRRLFAAPGPAAAVPAEGPPRRAARGDDVGAVLRKNGGSTVEKFAYLALRRGARGDARAGDTRTARVLRTPLKNRGNVVLDVCTHRNARATMSALLSQPVVIDNGTGVVKAGMAGGDRPGVVFASACGRAKHVRLMPGGALEGADVVVGRRAAQHRGALVLSRPMARGMVESWADMERVWAHCYGDEGLGVASDAHPLLLTEAPLNAARHRERAAELLFESFNLLLGRGALTTTAELDVVREVKERRCYVALDPAGDERAFGAASRRALSRRAWRRGERADDADPRAARRIVLAGGSTLFPGFGERLLKELRADLPDHTKIKIHAPPERMLSTWIGGSILASLATFKSMWVLRAEFEEHGARLFSQRAL
ncbi:hypothetical protein JL720_9735 [Aureococcus anophagefferens]|nr:hypothetical protein JL720_9735 [Aureococcus anophagefferens]